MDVVCSLEGGTGPGCFCIYSSRPAEPRAVLCHSLCVIAGCHRIISFVFALIRSFHLTAASLIQALPLETTITINRHRPQCCLTSPQGSDNSITMCIKVIERYAVCRCVYYSHSIDPCPAYGRHDVKIKEVLVGYTCTRHSVTRPQTSSQQPTYSDSGYASQGSQSQNYQNFPKSFRR